MNSVYAVLSSPQIFTRGTFVTFNILWGEGVCGGMDWIDLSVDEDRWRTLVSALMNLRVP